MRADTRSDTRRGRDVALAVPAAVSGALLAGHRLVPPPVSALLDSFLPWLGLPVLVLVPLAVFLRSRAGTLAALLPVVAWSVLFVPDLAASPDGGSAEFRVVTANLGGRALAGSVADAELVAVQELTDANRASVAAALDPGHPYKATVGTVGLWSRYPVSEVRRLDLGQGWPRALRARVRAPGGDVSVYAVHLASIRFGDSATRDRTLRTLAALVEADPSDRLLVAGDLNTASTDRLLAPLTTTLHDAREGFGFTWPAVFPLTRPDHILTRGFRTVDASVLEGGDSDHRAALAALAPG
ncbi:endonuclease/exonuclease/phosphatase family protein [Amycolatopsis sp. NPDC058340]|uniref:endonuclease/exonuclease/phosphatase family protein n=1 Tax=Amycolatopsis sp. NPDC058340 TaxID=3346453 RepID=UPI003662351A